MSKRDNLTKNQEIVFDLLQKSKEPLGAYSILFNTEKNGIKAPLQVYRALDKLIENGKVHRIESKNSYVACTNSDCNITKSTSFLICEKCDKVSEIKKNDLQIKLSELSKHSDFTYVSHNLEIYGLCENCAEASQL
ncbi:MAG: Fur family transcriptional regulator [Alphaproteobacteria bacterium]|nr:Fur family transcriptional regulator [Rhodobiaceae bacterium]OUT75100.1 MAG: Fur family transcriptional regulator [Rhizobiales bacterium TMED25]